MANMAKDRFLDITLLHLLALFKKPFLNLKLILVTFQPPPFFIGSSQTAPTREHDTPITTGALPIDEWTQYLEQDDEQLAGSGWGSIEMPGIDFVPASLIPQTDLK